jgi:hypothetical protein
LSEGIRTALEPRTTTPAVAVVVMPTRRPATTTVLVELAATTVLTACRWGPGHNLMASHLPIGLSAEP